MNANFVVFEKEDVSVPLLFLIYFLLFLYFPFFFLHESRDPRD